MPLGPLVLVLLPRGTPLIRPASLLTPSAPCAVGAAAHVAATTPTATLMGALASVSALLGALAVLLATLLLHGGAHLLVCGPHALGLEVSSGCHLLETRVGLTVPGLCHGGHHAPLRLPGSPALGL